jgi:hypothetical protein
MVQRRHTTLVRFSGLPSLAINVGIGALLHAIFHCCRQPGFRRRSVFHPAAQRTCGLWLAPIDP